MQHEVVAPTGDREWVELNRAELAEDLEYGAGAALERSRRREEVPGNEKTARGLSADPHPEDASYRDVHVALEVLQGSPLAAHVLAERARRSTVPSR